MNPLKFFPILLALLAFTTARAEDRSKSNIMDTLKADGHFKTLVTALEETKLADSLRAEGPFTLFAPTDDAFKTLPHMRDTLSDATHMKALLNNHLASKGMMLADLSKQTGVTMISGEQMAVSNSGKTIAQANIIVPDILATNGVIQGIDRVLTQSVEKKKQSAVETAPAPTNAYLSNAQPSTPPPPAEIATTPGYRIATEEHVRPDGTIERKDVVVPVDQTPPPAAAPVVVEQKEVIVEERPVRDVSVGGELKKGADKTYDGLKTGASKIKHFFTGN